MNKVSKYVSLLAGILSSFGGTFASNSLLKRVDPVDTVSELVRRVERFGRPDIRRMVNGAAAGAGIALTSGLALAGVNKLLDVREHAKQIKEEAKKKEEAIRGRMKCISTANNIDTKDACKDEFDANRGGLVHCFEEFLLGTDDERGLGQAVLDLAETIPFEPLFESVRLSVPFGWSFGCGNYFENVNANDILKCFHSAKAIASCIHGFVARNVDRDLDSKLSFSRTDSACMDFRFSLFYVQCFETGYLKLDNGKIVDGGSFKNKEQGRKFAGAMSSFANFVAGRFTFLFGAWKDRDREGDYKSENQVFNKLIDIFDEKLLFGLEKFGVDKNGIIDLFKRHEGDMKPVLNPARPEKLKKTIKGAVKVMIN